MFSKILAATDMISTVDPVVTLAARMAEQQSASLYILHVLESSYPDNRRIVKQFDTGCDVVTSPGYEERVRNELLNRYAGILTSRMTYHIRVVTGFPWEEILSWAKEIKVNLILMGPHSGRAEEKGVIRIAGKVGSTVGAVIQRERCPVMIVNSAMIQQKIDFKNMLIPIDFSRSCECAVCFAVRFAKHFSSKIIVFHMIPVLPFPKYSKVEYEADLALAHKRIVSFCRDYLDGTDHEYLHWGGSLPHLEIQRCAERQHADIIIMGSHTKEEKGKWYAGSAVERVGYRSKSPVIVITDPDVLTPWKRRTGLKVRSGKDSNRLIHVCSGGDDESDPHQEKIF